ncbi:PTS system cellobiose-specific IIA component [Mobilisporobacter senegalensis]|uniref:PTS system cellobiose-specific IIA component n=1 Tax=Mobilisporobacter senegalensis TaxID=1329262 RepID=A0A3N1XZ91_9FIRM|nr:PTS lactose/cellobiose transporter subunit IIA [Mobilisporobacter senegalensis]ROR31598.1 PTS system cellobiose-specific IIA component [Mobilisporobacter senegalensis]
MENFETILFQIISYVGSARSSYIEAIGHARSGDFDKSDELMKCGKDQFNEGHHAHMELIQKSASGELDIDNYQLLLMHAEDQLMSAEAFGILAEEFMELYKILNDKGIIGKA